MLAVRNDSYAFLRMEAMELVGARRGWFQGVWDHIHKLSEAEVGPVEPESQVYPDVELVSEEEPSVLEL